MFASSSNYPQRSFGFDSSAQHPSVLQPSTITSQMLQQALDLIGIVYLIIF